MPNFDSIRFQPSRPLLKELSADRLNALVAEIRKNRPRGERGITIRQSGDGTYIGLAAAIKAGGAPAQKFPWDIYVVDSPALNQYTVKVRPGTINSILPANWDDEFEIGAGIYYGFATIETDGKNITSINISISATAPTQQEPQKFGIESTIEYLFGVFSDGVAFNVLSQSITLLPRLRLVTSADPAAAPGQSPFDLWYELAR